MSSVQTKRPTVKHPSESRTIGINVANQLAGSDTVSSVSSIAAETGLTVGSAAVNAATFTDDDGETCAIGDGITFTCSGGSANSDYLVTIVFVTSSGGTQVITHLVQVRDR